MKYFTLFFFFAATFLAFAQTNHEHKGANDIIQAGTKPVESVLIYSTVNPTMRSSYTYDENGNKATWLAENLVSDQWTPTYLYTYSYDANGNMISNVIEKWAFTDDWRWTNYFRYTYSYDANDNLLTEFNEIWQNEQWVNYANYTYTYDENGNQIDYSYDKFEFQGEWKWVTYRQIISTYNSNNYILTKETRNLVNKIFKFYRTTYTWDENDVLLYFINEEKENDEWIFTNRFTPTFDENENEIESLTEEWDGADWIPSNQDFTTYNSEGNYLTWISNMWDGEGWIIEQKENYTYDEHGNQILYEYEYYEGGALNYKEQQTTTYNEFDEELTWLYEYIEDGEWVNGNQKTSTYDAEGNILSILHEEWDGTDWIYSNVILTIKDYKDRYFSFRGYKIEVTYDGGTDVEEEADNTNYFVNCSPNPANSFININYSLPNAAELSLKVISASGKEMNVDYNNDNTFMNNNSINLNVSNFAQGVYFYILQRGANVYKGRFVVIR